jgi:hypothetical protein
MPTYANIHLTECIPVSFSGSSQYTKLKELSNRFRLVFTFRKYSTVMHGGFLEFGQPIEAHEQLKQFRQ